MADNEQFNLHTDLRKELETKIDKKLDSATFGLIIMIVFGAIGTGYFWLMNMNEKVTRVETKIEDTRFPSNQPSVIQPAKK